MDKRKLKLGVNIDHVATLREARGTSYPCPLEAAHACARAGADGITIHLREDRRHIQDTDVYAIRAEGKLPLNLEMANAPEIVRIALDVCPDEVCLVPEKREELTTEGGLNADEQRETLRPTVEALKKKGIIVSLFVEAQEAQLEAASELGVPFVELHTGRFCDVSAEKKEEELETLCRGAERAHQLGLSVNAGHGINAANVKSILTLPHLQALNIGHSIVARAVFVGLEEAVREMLEAMRGGLE